MKRELESSESEQSREVKSKSSNSSAASLFNPVDSWFSRWMDALESQDSSELVNLQKEIADAQSLNPKILTPTQIQDLVNLRNLNGSNALMLLLADRFRLTTIHLEAVKWLVEKEVDLSVEDLEQDTVLEILLYSYDDVYHALFSDLFKYFLDKVICHPKNTQLLDKFTKTFKTIESITPAGPARTLVANIKQIFTKNEIPLGDSKDIESKAKPSKVSLSSKFKKSLFSYNDLRDIVRPGFGDAFSGASTEKKGNKIESSHPMDVDDWETFEADRIALLERLTGSANPTSVNKSEYPGMDEAIKKSLKEHNPAMEDGEIEDPDELAAIALSLGKDSTSSEKKESKKAEQPKPIISGNDGQYRYEFNVETVPGDGDCSFKAIKLERIEVVKTLSTLTVDNLREYAKDTQLRRYFVNEIFDWVMGSRGDKLEYKESVKSVLNEGYRIITAASAIVDTLPKTIQVGVKAWRTFYLEVGESKEIPEDVPGYVGFLSKIVASDGYGAPMAEMQLNHLNMLIKCGKSGLMEHQNIINFCFNRDTIQAYCDYLSIKGKINTWGGHGLILLLGTLKGERIFIWEKQKDGSLKFATATREVSPTQATTHVMMSEHRSHYDRLIVIKKEPLVASNPNFLVTLQTGSSTASPAKTLSSSSSSS